MHQKISHAYTNHRTRLGARFPAASEFLLRVEREGGDRQLWLSTAQNAHIYRGRMFIAYVGLRNPERFPFRFPVDGIAKADHRLKSARLDAELGCRERYVSGMATRMGSGAG
jgi:hypothetical protein